LWVAAEVELGPVVLTPSATPRLEMVVVLLEEMAHRERSRVLVRGDLKRRAASVVTVAGGLIPVWVHRAGLAMAATVTWVLGGRSSGAVAAVVVAGTEVAVMLPTGAAAAVATLVRRLSRVLFRAGFTLEMGL